MIDDKPFRARLVSFDHSHSGQQKTLIAGMVAGSLGHATHGEILDVEITVNIVRRMRSLVPLGDIMSATARLGRTPQMVDDGDLVIIEGREATRTPRPKCVCNERPPATCVCEFMRDDVYEERSR